MTHLRKRGRFGEIVSEETLDVPIPDRAADLAVDRDELARGMATLPEGQRTVLVLKDVYGLSCREIGHELGIEEGAVKVRLHRARKRLKELLSSDDERAGQL
jgi:RNA polymerase sigma-70 factor (ECF subfamily)